MDKSEWVVVGTEDSEDLIVKACADAEGRIIELNSKVKALFGPQILSTVNEVLDERRIQNIHLIIDDKGALDFAIRGRLKTALKMLEEVK